MSKANEPAFPLQSPDDHWSLKNLPGLTKREYFAAMAMQGMLSSFSNPQSIAQLNDVASRRELTANTLMAKMATKYADALLQELETESTAGTGS